MLRPAIQYETELTRIEAKCLYDLKYMYLNSNTGREIIELSRSNSNIHDFVSVNKYKDVLGWIGYEIDWESKSAIHFGMCCYCDKPSVQFARDLRQAIDNIFNIYHLNRIEWRCYADNPAIRGYRNFCKKYGGREVGTLKQTTLLMDGKIHDTVIFELMAEDYISHMKNGT